MVSNPFSDGVSVEINAQTGQFQSKLDGVIGKLGSFRTQVGLAGAALAGLAAGALGKATKAAASYEEALIEVEKTTDPETAEAMSDSIMEMAETIPLTQDALAGLTADAARFGIRGQENLEGFVQSTARLATATDLNASQAGESMAKLAKLTDTPISEVENLGSAINSLANTSATSSQEVVDSMLRASGELSNLGLKQTEIASLSASLNSVSESSERSGTRLRRLAQEITNSDPEELSEALGVTKDRFVEMRENSPNDLIMMMAEKMGKGEDSADDLRDSLSTVSQQALTGLGSNLEGTAEAQQTANESFEEGTSLQEEFDSATNTTNSKLKIAKNRLRGIGISIGEQVLPHINELLEYVSDAISDFSTLNEKTDGLAGTFTIVGSGIAAAGVALAALVGGPVTLAIGAAAALAAAWAMGWEDTKQAISDGVDMATEALGEIASWIKENGPGLVDDAVSIFKDMLNTAGSWIKENGPGIAKEAFKKVGEGIRFIALDIYNGITGNDDSILKSVLIDIASWLKNEGPGVLKEAAKVAFDVIMAAAEGLYEGLIGNSLIPDMFSDIGGYIKDDAASDLASAAKGAFGDLKDAALEPMEDLKTGVEDIVGEIEDKIDAVMDRINDAKDAADDVKDGATETGKNIVDKGKEFVSDPLDSLDTGGKITSNGIYQGHAGERVLNPAEIKQLEEFGGGTSISIGKIEASSYQEGKQAAKGFTDELRSAGFRP